MRRKAFFRHRRGVSLAELLVVIAILSILFAVGGMQITRVIQKQKLVATAGQIEAFAHRAFLEMQRRNQMTFLYLAARSATDGTQELRIYGDSNGNGAPDPGTDALVDTYVIQTRSSTIGDGDISLSTSDFDLVESANWSSNVTAASTARWLRIDFQGRTSNVATVGSQIAGVATLTITHVFMVGSGATLTPPLNYRLRISPLWSAKVDRPIL